MFNESTRKLRDLKGIEIEKFGSYGIGTIRSPDGQVGHTGGDLGLNSILTYNYETNITFAAVVTSEGLSRSLATKILSSPKVNVKNINGDKVVEQKFQIAKQLRKLFTRDDLVFIHRIADREPDFFRKANKSVIIKGRLAEFRIERVFNVKL